MESSACNCGASSLLAEDTSDSLTSNQSHDKWTHSARAQVVSHLTSLLLGLDDDLDLGILDRRRVGIGFLPALATAVEQLVPLGHR